MTNLLSVSSYIAQQLAANAPSALTAWEFLAEMRAPQTLSSRKAVVELYNSTELVPGNMSCRVEGRVIAAAGGDTEAEQPAIDAELAALMHAAAQTLTSLGGTAPALDAAGNGVIFYRVIVGQQTVSPDRNFAQLLTVLPFTLYIQL